MRRMIIRLQRIRLLQRIPILQRVQLLCPLLQRPKRHRRQRRQRRQPRYLLKGGTSYQGGGVSAKLEQIFPGKKQSWQHCWHCVQSAVLSLLFMFS